jgi:Xaa-Pro dipeptidase
MNELKLRLEKLDRCRDPHLDGIVLLNFNVHDPNFFYFTNSEVNGTFFYDFEKPRLFVSSMEFKSAKKSWVHDVIKIEKIDEINKHIKGRIGINGNAVSFNGYRKIRKMFKPVDISKKLDEIRMIKTRRELSYIKKACQISGNVYKEAGKEISKNITEFGMKTIIETKIFKFNVTPAFPTIVTTGKNIAEPHHIPCKTKLGETTLIDFGVKYNGYCSDVSRTIGSKYEKTIEKLMKMIEWNIKPGVMAKDIDAIARKHLLDNKKFFITSLGHGVGIDVHEKPHISKSSEDVILPGMTLRWSQGYT